MAMFDAIGDMLTGGSNVAQIAGAIGGTEEGTKTAAAAAVPLLLGGLQKRSATQQGAQALFNMVQSDDGSVLDRLSSVVSGGDTSGMGSTLVGSILGGRRSTVESTLAQSSGLSAGAIAKFLPMVAPMVMGFLGRKQSAEGLDRDGLKSALAEERGVLDDVGFGQWMGLLDGGDPIDDDKGFQSGIAKIAGLGGLGLLGGGAARAVTSVTSPATPAVTAPAATAPKIGASSTTAASTSATSTSAASAPSARVTSPATTTTTTTGTTPTRSSVSTGTTQRTDYSIGEPEKKRFGWLKWLLPLLLAALLALVLWSCLSGGDGDSDNTDETSAEPTAVAEPDPTAVPTEVPEEPTAVPTEVPTAVPTEVPEEPTPVPEPEIVGYVPGRILSTAEGDGGFTTLLAAVDDAGLRETLETDGPFTVLAPIDSAFDFLPGAVLDQLSDPDVLGQVLAYHVIPDSVSFSNFETGTAPTVGGGELFIDTEGFQTRVNGAVVLDADLQTENGLIQIIDRVLIPPSILRAAGLTVNEALSLEPVLFEVGSAQLTAEGQQVLDGAIPFLASTEGAVEIGGHTDSDGEEETNLALSQDRADTVLAYLVENGIAADRLTAVGYGEAEPVQSNDTPTGKEANRRIEFTLR